MAGLVPAISIHGAKLCQPKRDARHKAGHDSGEILMPLQNRVSPFGELFATPARGLLMGNRGGRIHNDNKS